MTPFPQQYLQNPNGLMSAHDRTVITSHSYLSNLRPTLLVLCSAITALSAQISLSNQSAGPGSSILSPGIFAAQTASISGIQFDLEYDSTTLNLATTLGEALRQSGKNMYIVDLASNRKRVLIVGPNQNQIPDGTLFILIVNVNAAAPQGLYQLKVSSIVGTNPNGLPASVLGVSAIITVDASAAITPVQPNGVLNAASLTSGPVVPGEFITILGSAIGKVAGTSVMFDGIPAPVLFVAPNQINAVAPHGIYTKINTRLTVAAEKQPKVAVTLAVGQAAPAIFTVGETGVGQGAILNQDSTINSPTNPAEKGSVVALFATGAGQTDPAGTDGQLASDVLPKPLLPVAVRIGGIATQVQYAGAAPALISGILQVNAKIPQNAPSGATVPIELIVGQSFSPTGVTVAIK